MNRPHVIRRWTLGMVLLAGLLVAGVLIFRESIEDRPNTASSANRDRAVASMSDPGYSPDSDTTAGLAYPNVESMFGSWNAGIDILGYNAASTDAEDSLSNGTELTNPDESATVFRNVLLGLYTPRVIVGDFASLAAIGLPGSGDNEGGEQPGYESHKPILCDDFEKGVEDSVWKEWAGNDQKLLQVDTKHNKSVGGNRAAHADVADVVAYTAVTDLEATKIPAGKFLRADVYVYEDRLESGADSFKPVTNMLALIGDNGTSRVGLEAEYLQIGVVPSWPGGSQSYGFRTRYNDSNGGGVIASGVGRKAGWIKLSIEVDSYGDGGAVRFYIDDNLIGTSYRAGANAGAGGLSAAKLRWLRLGNNSNTYEDFWYDDVCVTLESMKRTPKP